MLAHWEVIQIISLLVWRLEDYAKDTSRLVELFLADLGDEFEGVHHSTPYWKAKRYMKQTTFPQVFNKDTVSLVFQHVAPSFKTCSNFVVDPMLNRWYSRVMQGCQATSLILTYIVTWQKEREMCIYIYMYIYMHIYTSTACIVIYTYIRSSMYRKGTWSNHCGLLKTLCVGVSVAYVGGLDHFLGFPHILGTSSPQLTNSYFPAGVGFNHQPDKHLWQILACWGHFAAHCASDSRRIHKPTPARASQSQSWRCRDDAKTV